MRSVDIGATRWRAVLSVTRQLHQERDFTRVATFIVETLGEVIEADRCSLFLHSPEQGDLVLWLADGLDRPIRVPLGRGVAGWVGQEKRSVLCLDANADERFDGVVDEVTGYRTRSIVAAPLIAPGGELMGVLEGLNKRKGEFTDADRELLEVLAGQAAISLANARLLGQTEAARRRTEDSLAGLELLLQIERGFVPPFSMDDLFSLVIEKTAKAVTAEAGSILLCDHEATRLYFRMASGERSEALRSMDLDEEEGIAGWAITHDESVLTNDISTDERYAPRIARTLGIDIQGIIAVPLRTQDGVLGAIEMINRHGRPFDEGDLKLVEVVAARVGDLLNSAKEARRRMAEQKLAAIGSFTNGIIHDLKNPLTVIRGIGEMIRRRPLKEDRRESYADGLIRQSDRCVEMISDLLDFARGKIALNRSFLDLHAFIDDVLEMSAQRIDAQGVVVEREIDVTGPLMADAARLRRCILNLVNNALDVLPTAGRLRFEVTEHEGIVQLRLTDNGPGISPDIRGKLFGNFVTHGKEKGTGLGLAIARNIAEAHGGELLLDETVDTGASFVLRIPREEPSPAA